MTQHDMTIANAGGAAARADINAALAALSNLQAGITAPSVTFPHQLWMDTSTTPAILKQRNASDTGWNELLNVYVQAPVGGVGDGNIAVYDGTDGKKLKQRTFAQIKASLALAKGDVGLGSVDNTSDADKPVSTAQAAAIALKEPLGETPGINPQTASYTLALADKGKVVEMNVATANNLTVPPNSSVAFPINTRIDIAQYGAGQTTVVAGSGVTIRSEGSKLKLKSRYGGASLYKRGTDEWVLVGNLAT